MINKRRYVIDYAKFAIQRIPVPIRFADVIAFVMVLIGPIVNVYNSFKLFRDMILYKLTITPQVVYLEKMLNDRYDTVQRRIYIIDGREYDPLYVFIKIEAKPIWFYRKSEGSKPKIYLYTKGEGNQVTFDFVVMVPNGTNFNLNEMTSLIDEYRLRSKIYTIQTF